MTRQVITAQSLLGAYPALPITPGAATLSQTSNSDQTDRTTPLVDSKTLVTAHNSDSGAQTITFTSVADSPYNRAGDITAYSLAAGEIAYFGPFKTAGWASSGQLLIDVSDAKVLLTVITLP